MYEYPKHNNYDLDPKLYVPGFAGAVRVDNSALIEALVEQIAHGAMRICFELYPGVDEQAVIDGVLRKIPQLQILRSEEARLSQETLLEKYRGFIKDDRVFGIMCGDSLDACFDPDAIQRLRMHVSETDMPCVVVGVGASLVLPDADRIWYWDINRWEIQLRYRRGMGTWLVGSLDGQQLTKYKVGFFLEWRFADRQKRNLLEAVSNWVDANDPACPRMVPATAFHAALDRAVSAPFRMQAYYDPSVWGGQWMKRVFNLDPSVKNYGWSFDGVPEENAVKFDFDGEWAMFPAMDLVLARSRKLLGEHVYGRFGAEFPIRFDFLDTMEGGNLSLQVHPLTSYIQEKFGMHYTQDESYYILDATENSCVYLGLLPNVDPKEMHEELNRAQRGESAFPAERFVNCFPVKKHDHVLIPAGTVHCSGKDTVVLEVSATPYIFTFKLWDWGRIGLDGLPRPIHIEHGIVNVQFDRDTAWVKRELLHQQQTIAEDGSGIIEQTGLHNLEFIETQRHTVCGSRVIDCCDSVVVINLVEGHQAQIAPADGSVEPVVIHYAETFIVPANIQQFVIHSEEPVMLLTAKVR